MVPICGFSQERAEKEEQSVSHRAAWRFDAQMNSACDNEERTDDDHEGHIIDSRVNDARGLVNNKKMIQTNYTGESDAKLVVMTLPMTLSDERSECDRHQQDHKRHHDQPVRKCRGEAQNRNHPVIGLVVVRLPSMKLGFVALALRNGSKTPRSR